MSADVERRIVTAVLRTGDLVTAQSAGVNIEWFTDLQCRTAWQVILDYSLDPRTAGTVPGLSYMVERMAMVPHVGDASETVAQLSEAMRAARHKYLLGVTMAEAMVLNEKDPAAAHLKLQTRLLDRDIESLRSRGVESTLGGLASKLYQDYKDSVSDQGVIGVQTPFPALTYATKGFRPGNLYTFFAAEGSYKCLKFDAPILQRDGTFRPIGDMPDACEVPSFTEATGKVRWARAKLVRSGVKNCVRITTSGGRRLECGEEHLIMTPGFEFRRARDLALGDWIAFGVTPPVCDETGEMSPADAHLLGLLIGDGGLTRNEISFTKQEPSVVRAVEEHVERWGCRLNHRVAYDYSITQAGAGNRMIDWLRDLGVMGHKSVDKFVPDIVFRSGRETIAAFLAGLLDTDGSVAIKPRGCGCVMWCTSSPKLATQTVQLLWRLGVKARDQVVSSAARRAEVSDQAGLAAVWAAIGPYMRNEAKIRKLSQVRERVGGEVRFRRDSIPTPAGLREHVEQLMHGRQWPRDANGSRVCLNRLFRNPVVYRRDLDPVVDATGDDLLKKLQRAELRFEKVVRVEELGEHECFDFCIEDGQDPNYLTEDFVVHNTWLGLACAVEAWRARPDQNVLIVTSEMPDEECAERVACLINGWNFNDYRDRKLPPAEILRWFSTDQARRLHFLMPSGLDVQAIAEVRAKIQELNLKGGVSLVVWDGHYRSALSPNWEDIARLVKGTRGLALEKEIQQPPILAIAQEGSNKGAVSNRVYAQESTLMLLITKIGFGKVLAQATKMRAGLKPEMEIAVNLVRGLITEVSAKFDAEISGQSTGGLV